MINFSLNVDSIGVICYTDWCNILHHFRSSMLNIRSKITQKLLAYFFLNEENKLYVNELVRTLSVDRGKLVKKLKELEKQGLFQSEWQGNQKYYFLNRQFPFFEEYKKIVGKTMGFENELRQALKKIKGLEEIYILGSYAQNTMDQLSDIDLLVIGKQDSLALYRVINKVQKQFSREINVVEMSSAEFEKKIQKKDLFIKDVLDKPHIKLLENAI